MSHLVVRDLKPSASQIPLADALRAHLPPETLEKLGFRIGEVCKITAEDGSATGYAIAWRAAEKLGSPKNPPIKLSETLREACGFKLGAQVAVEKATVEISTARRIVLTELTPADTDLSLGADDKCWKIRCHHALIPSNCEAIMANVSFDVMSKPRGPKKRFFVESVEAGALRDRNALFTCNDFTEIVIQDVPIETATSATAAPVLEQLRLSTRRIGGLLDQIDDLNQRLRGLISKSAAHLCNGVLLQGYEGTGKSLLLSELSKLPFRKIVRIDKAALVGTPTKMHATVRAMFDEAVAYEPSMVLMDDLDHIASPESDVYVEALAAGLDMIRGRQVIAVGTTRNAINLDRRITNPSRLASLIELPVPDLTARTQILGALLHMSSHTAEDVPEMVAAVTHGYTGKDLAALKTAADWRAWKRHDAEQQDWVKIHSQPEIPSNFVQNVAHSSNASEEITVPTTTVLDYEAAMVLVKPTALREVILEPPNISWSDVGGSEAMKERFDEIIGWPLHHADILTQQYPGTKPQKGVLLYGPPGCSKTITAQAVATTYRLNFLAVKGAELISSYVGESERAVREVFRKARAAQPSIIFFDEIDSIGGDRGNDGTKGLNVLTTLLNEMDGFEALKGVFVLAATNRPEVLDPALLRPGRFDEHVYIGPPNCEARGQILSLSLRKKPVAEDMDIARLAEAMAGYSGADIVAISRKAVHAAIKRAIKGQDGRVYQNDFEVALAGTKKSITSDMLNAYQEFLMGHE